MWKYSLIILIAALFYTWMNYTQTYLLVLLQVDGRNVERLKEIYNVQAAFKVHSNVDSHMAIDGVMDHQKMSEKLKWNFILLTSSFPSEKASLKFGDNLRKYDFIQSFSIFPFDSKPLQVNFYNAIFLLKGFIGRFVIAIQPTFTKENSEEGDDVFETTCSDEELVKEEPNIMVNIVKFKDIDEMEKYSGTVVMKMFPALGTTIFTGGVPKSDYWDQIGLIVYKNRASLCQMVLSKEFKAVLPHKQKGLEDTHTYLTTTII